MRFRIAVIGSGYVGLVVGVCFASRGFRVVCVDVDVERVRRIGRGEAPFYEPKLDELLCDAVNRGLLSSTTDVAEAVDCRCAVFLCDHSVSLRDGLFERTDSREPINRIRPLRNRATPGCF